VTLTFGSLFSGIGGLDLGLERAGMRCVWQSEIDPYCCKVLAKHWPDIPNIGDINDVDWRNVATVDVICGGYPCQPFSVAGARNGTNDPKHLWPKFADAIRILRPRYALLENVTGHLNLGFSDVLADLASCGYDAQWDCIPAATVGAPHLRDRVFVIATRQTLGMDTGSDSKPNVTVNAKSESSVQNRAEQSRIVADTVNTGLHDTVCAGRYAFRNGRQNDGAWQHWQTEPDVGRMAHGIPNRMDRLRALGNAVVPQVAEHVAHVLIHRHQQLVASANDPCDLT